MSYEHVLNTENPVLNCLSSTEGIVNKKDVQARYRYTNWGAVKAMVAMGMTMRETAEHFGIPLSAVNKRATREKWKVSAIAKKHKEILAKNEIPMDNLMDYLAKSKGRFLTATAKTLTRDAEKLAEMKPEGIKEMMQVAMVAKTHAQAAVPIFNLKGEGESNQQLLVQLNANPIE